MPCTTILVGKNASADRSTIIARNEDFQFTVKKIEVVTPDKQPMIYKSKISHVTVPLPENPMRYTSCPSVDRKEGIWAAAGINAANVGMTATETTTSNPRVMGADPMVVYKPAKGKEKAVPGGIGEEDFVVLVLPYVHTAREGVLRLGALLEQYGTYEMNGIGFNDENECWWFETIGGHHWMARRVKDDEIVIMPNQFGLDRFDFDDAFGEGRENLCSADLREFIRDNQLDLSQDGAFNPRYVFGSHSDADHIYNTPRAWYMARYFLSETYRFDGENADFGPESDNIPWSFIPDKKVTVEDVKYVLSSYYQGTPYNPYLAEGDGRRGYYRVIGISRTTHLAILQIRSDVPDAVKGVEWISFAANPFNASLPLYTNVDSLPAYLTNVTLTPSTDTLYWNSRMIAALADPHFGACIQPVERYQTAVGNQSRAILHEYDKKITESGDASLCAEANRKLVDMMKKETSDFLGQILLIASQHMKISYSRADH